MTVPVGVLDVTADAFVLMGLLITLHFLRKTVRLWEYKKLGKRDELRPFVVNRNAQVNHAHPKCKTTAHFFVKYIFAHCKPGFIRILSHIYSYAEFASD